MTTNHRSTSNALVPFRPAPKETALRTVDVLPSSTSALTTMNGLIPTLPGRIATDRASWRKNKWTTRNFEEFEQQTKHAAAGMRNLEQVQQSFVELQLIEQHGEKRSHELTHEIAVINNKIIETKMHGQQIHALYPEHLELERTKIRAQVRDIEFAGRTAAIDLDRAELQLEQERHAHREKLLAFSIDQANARALIADANVRIANADVEASLTRERGRVAVAEILAESGPTLLRAEREERERNRRDAAERTRRTESIRATAEIIANQAVAGAVQVPDVSPYSAFAWVTYQQEWDRFHDHDKSFNATVAQILKRMTNGGMSREDAQTNYATYERMLAAGAERANERFTRDIFNGLGVTDADHHGTDN